MKKPKIESKPPRTFRDAVEVFLAKGGAFPDISLAGFLVEHAGMDRHASIASIGPVPHVEALALNALASSEAAYVLLGSGTLTGSHSFAADLTGENRSPWL